ncbi:MAG: CPXCG motif-containing cysteine-rich protein [Reinekea sp.]|nr:CPXCG motif-containing cysteine-rich protein [Reinekea sp.]MDX1474758.1 CPXCG motif-containing cysteine-rich protein [Reinekea sp.]
MNTRLTVTEYIIMQEDLSTETSKQYCPYCGEHIRLIIEPFDEPQTYTEDCEVCCRPMIVQVEVNGDVFLQREDD